jgi:hypothetical protein
MASHAFKYQASGAVFAVLLLFFFFQDVKGVAGEIKSSDSKDAPFLFQIPPFSYGFVGYPIPFCLVLREANELLISPHPPKSKPLEEDSGQTY